MTVRGHSPKTGLLLLALGVVCAAGCGSTKSRTATEQLLVSDAVDAAIAQVDFSHLAGEKVYLDRTYIVNHASLGFINAEYVISAIRQQIIGSGCLLMDKAEDADFIIEGRIGALGMNSHDIIYGLPANNLLNAAASVVPGTPAAGVTSLPTIPEISLAKKNDQLGAAKLGLFAYHRETKNRVWQSGVALGHSRAKDTWFMGAGPYQSGSVYEQAKSAGSNIALSESENKVKNQVELSQFRDPAVFVPPSLFHEKPAVAHASSEDENPSEETEDQKVVPASAEAPQP